MVLNFEMPNKNALMISPVQYAEHEYEHKNIVVVSVYDNEAALISAIQSGATGYILNNFGPKELAQALVYISKASKSHLLTVDTNIATEFRASSEQSEVSNNDLSNREGEVLQLVAEGAGNKIIASTLFISQNTVKTHLRNIMNKLGVVNRSQAAVYAVRGNLIHE